jgi:hypothetical protein
MLGWVVLASLAGAHPGGHTGADGGVRGALGHRTELSVSPDTVTWKFTLEIPEKRLVVEARQDAVEGGDPETFLARTLQEVSDGMHVTLDGQPLPLERLPVALPSTPGEPGFVELRVHAQGKLPGPGTLALRDGVRPLEEGNYFLTRVELDGSWVVSDTSLLRVEDGKIEDDRHGVWVREETMRTPQLRLRPSGYFERRSGLVPLPLRVSGAPGVAPEPWALGLAVLGLVGIGAFGRWAGRRARAAREEAARADAEARGEGPGPDVADEADPN